MSEGNTVSVSLSVSEQTVKLVLDTLVSERLEQKKLRGQMFEGALEKLMALLPSILAQLGGKSIPDERGAGALALVDSLDAEQIMSFAKNLREDQRQSLLDLIDSKGGDLFAAEGTMEPSTEIKEDAKAN